MVKQIKRVGLILISALILAASVNLFMSPHHVAAGGASGLGVIIEYALNIDRSITVLIFNIVVLVLAALFLGKEYFFNTLIGAIAFPVFLGMLPEYMVVSDRFLSIIIGSIGWAIGVSILYNIQASIGGTTIPPLILEKFFHISPSIGLLVSDAIVVCLSLYIFGIESFFFALISIAITSVVMTYLETGINRKKAIIIVTSMDPTEFREKMDAITVQTLVMFTVQSGEENKRDTMKLIVTSDKEYPVLKQAISQIDPQAFVMAYNVSEVSDLGLTYHPSDI
ncbi:YitT family protein [Vagococcus zengguangii]|uniref:YitT family protein n=1 Tax=Vagococcus zengguangii TaxID=2571750 RepID=A0A4D7CS15_9ENTE|nr:YitT family protein [Vagococcus zengguangii]QCI85813.1 YitT family protein [Vagococcus zengguangii]TLG81754.1 YitT family protein [Vagococcus zengguangii]